MLTPNIAAQRVAAFIAGASAASFAAKVGGATATPNALGRAVTGYTGHSRMFTQVRQQLRNGGYRANPQWPALTLAQWQAVYGVQPHLASKATPKQQQAAQGRLGKVLAAAAGKGGAVPRRVLPPLASTRTQAAPKVAAAASKGAAASKAASTQPQAAPTPAPVPTPAPAGN